MIDEEALRSIEKLHQMKQDGVISEAEFEKAKQDLLEGRSRVKAKSTVAVVAEVAPYPDLPADQDFSGWLVLALRRYAVFNGRSCRKEFWMFQVVIAVVLIILTLATSDNGSPYGYDDSSGNAMVTGLASVALLGLLVPAVAVQVRRFHDQDKTGWFALLNLVPYLGPFIIMGFMLIDGTPGDNQYGPDPKDR